VRHLPLLLLLPVLVLSCRGDRFHRADDTSAEEGRPAASVRSRARIGQLAPDFELRDLSGGTVRLSAFRGNRVVLEWTSPECPFCEHAHTHGALRDLAARLMEKGIVWLAINSCGAEKPGGALEKNREAAERWDLPHPLLLDPTGEVGRLYDATTTPEMYVIDERGALVYVGALDNAPFGKVRGGGEVIDYVEAALADLDARRAVAVPTRQAYGCRVKYAQPVLSR